MQHASPASAHKGDSLARRIASAVIGIPLLLLLVWLGGIWLTALAIVAALLGLQEFYRLSGVFRRWLQQAPGFLLAIILVLNGRWPTVWPLLPVVAGLLLLLLSHVGSPKSARPWLLTLAGPLYVGATMAYAVLLRNIDQGMGWLLLALLGTFAVDTSAYFVGRAIGRHRMAPKISPGKTWEGAIAGMTGGVGATFLLVAVLSLPLVLWKTAVLGAGIGVIAQAGDLLESALKRSARAKEAGWLIPGHGGILDRMDSIVFNLVLVYHFGTWGAT